MTSEEIAAWRHGSLEGYVADRVAAGEPEEVARSQGEQQFAAHFPDGQPGERHRVHVAEVEGERVGIAWTGPHPRQPEDTSRAWLFDIEVDESCRGRGYGRAILTAVENALREDGVRELGLNVFGPNTTARNLYTSSGYREVAVSMSKPL
jgi:GNAT superfamily N-acetyltransferase